VLHRPYWQEISDGLSARGIKVFHVLLDAEESVLRQRVSGSGEAVEWRLEHLADYRDARSWLTEAADLTLDTGASSPADVACHIAEAVPAVAKAAPVANR
jgi:L-rhamnose mutarotase